MSSGQDLIERTRKGLSQNILDQGAPNRLYNDLHTNKNFNNAQEFNLFKVDNEKIKLSKHKNYLEEAPIYLTINEKKINDLLSISPEEIIRIGIPVDNKRAFNITLKEYNCLSGSFEATTKEGEYIDNSDIKTFRGVLDNNPSSIVALTISKNNFQLIISDNVGNYSLGSHEGSKIEYVLLNDATRKNNEGFGCGSEELYKEALNSHIEQYQKTSTIGCVDIFIEADNDIYVHNGDSEQTLFTIMSLFNQVASVYCVENIDVNISDVEIWTTVDPYNTMTSMGGILDAFAVNTQNAFNGDLAHLLLGETRGSTTGIAWIDKLGAMYNPSCNTSSGQRPCGPYGVTARINWGHLQYPTYSDQVSTFAHELGHNFGSRHTHACVWNGNDTAIDGCSTPVGCPDPGPTTNGTIMSYCSNYPLSNAFGTQPGNLIRAKLNSAINGNLIDGSCSCSVPCPEDFVYISFGHTYLGTWGYYGPRTFGDVNGDGKDDAIGFASAGVRVALSTGNDIVYDSNWNIPHFGIGSGGWNTDLHIRKIIDLDGDGMDDIVGFGNAAVYVSLSTGTSFNNPVNWTDGYGPLNGWTIDDHPRLFGDFNNDGLHDFVGFANALTMVEESDGTKFVRNTAFNLFHFYLNQGWSAAYPRLVGDIDGDGFDDDIVGFGPNEVQVVTSDGSVFSSVSNWTTNFTASQGWSINFHPRFLADVDGDGDDDIVGFANEGVRVGLSNGTSFEPQQLWVNNFGVNNGFTVANHPRFVTDINGDGMADIIGFGNAAVYFSLSNGTGFDAPTLLTACYGFNDGWSDIDYIRGHADFSGNGNQEIVAMGCGGTFIHFEKNNECTSAIELSLTSTCNPLTISNEGFSASGELPPFSCGNAGTTVDSWFTVEVPPSGSITIESTQVTGGLTDMIMQVLAGTCGSFTEVSCDDDSGSGTHSLVSLTGRTPGEILYVRVVEYGSDNFGEFGICAHDNTPTCPPDYAGTNQLTGTQGMTVDFETNGILQSDQIIDADVDYDSGTHIDLLIGFEVKIGKLFHAFIDGCGNLFREKDEDSETNNIGK